MTTGNLSWQDAIIRVLEDAGEPLHYQDITNRIGQQRLRDLTGAAPAGTVNSLLSQMIRDEDRYSVRKVGRGIFKSAAPSLGDTIESDESDEIDEDQSEDEGIILVSAFGLYWERDKVRWNSNAILGRQASNSVPVNFAEQQGVYLLHNGRTVVYVGRTTSGTLYNRLRSHNNASDSKALRWDSFSWFGLRGVDNESGTLTSFDSNISMSELIIVLESVLIEALEPPTNARRGDRMGELYQQVIDPQIQEQMRRDYFASLAR